MPAGRPTLYTDLMPIRLVETLSTGKSLTIFCRDMGIHVDTAYEWIKIHPEFSEALRRGRTFQQAVWEEKLEGFMLDKSVNAPLVKWYMTNVFKWSDKQEIKQESHANITFQEATDIQEVRKKYEKDL